MLMMPKTLTIKNMQRLMYHGKLTNLTKRRSGIQTKKVDPTVFNLTACHCDKPQNICNLRQRPNKKCRGLEDKEEAEERIFTVIQETKTRCHRGFICMMLEIPRSYQCEGFDHSINIDHLTYENRPVQVPDNICGRMAHRRELETYN